MRRQNDSVLVGGWCVQRCLRTSVSEEHILMEERHASDWELPDNKRAYE